MLKQNLAPQSAIEGSSDAMSGDVFWTAQNPSSICATSELARLAGGDALGLSVHHIKSIENIGAEAISDKIVILTLSGDLSAAQSYVSTVRDELYSLCDSRLRPFCSSTHRPYPLRDLRQGQSPQREGSRAEYVSLALIDAGAFTKIQSTNRSSQSILSDSLESILRLKPAMIIVCSDGGHWVEDVYGAHARVRHGDVLPLLMFSSRMSFSSASSADRVPHAARLMRDYPLSLLQGKAMLQLGVQRERNAQSDYDVALEHGVSVVEYLYLLGYWRNAMNGREVSPLEHVFDHLDKMTSLGWSKDSLGMHVAFSLDVIANQWDLAFAESGPFGCSMKDLGAILTYLGRTGMCRVLHIMGATKSNNEAVQSARMVGSLIYKLVLLREEYSGT